MWYKRACLATARCAVRAAPTRGHRWTVDCCPRVVVFAPCPVRSGRSIRSDVPLPLLHVPASITERPSPRSCRCRCRAFAGGRRADISAIQHPSMESDFLRKVRLRYAHRGAKPGSRFVPAVSGWGVRFQAPCQPLVRLQSSHKITPPSPQHEKSILPNQSPAARVTQSPSTAARVAGDSSAERWSAADRPILVLMSQFRADTDPRQVCRPLRGAFDRNESGPTPILSRVRRAEKAVLDFPGLQSRRRRGGQCRVSHLHWAGGWCLGDGGAIRHLRAAGVRYQAPGGCGALRVGGPKLIRTAAALTDGWFI